MILGSIQEDDLKRETFNLDPKDIRPYNEEGVLENEGETVYAYTMILILSFSFMILLCHRTVNIDVFDIH